MKNLLGILLFLLLTLSLSAQTTITGSVDASATATDSTGVVTVSQSALSFGTTATNGGTVASVSFSTNSGNPTVSKAVVSQKYFDVLTVGAGMGLDAVVSSYYQGFGGVGGTGVQSIINIGNVTAGAFIPVTFDAQTGETVLKSFKGAASLKIADMTIAAGVLSSVNSPTLWGSAGISTSGLTVAFDAQYFEELVTFSPSLSYAPTASFNFTLDSLTDSKDVVKNSVSSFTLNYTILTGLSTAAKVKYTGLDGSVNTTASISYLPLPNTTIKYQADIVADNPIVNTFSIALSQAF